MKKRRYLWLPAALLAAALALVSCVAQKPADGQESTKQPGTTTAPATTAPAAPSLELMPTLRKVIELSGYEADGEDWYYSALESAADVGAAIGAKEDFTCSFKAGYSYNGVMGAFTCLMLQTETHEQATALAAQLEANANPAKYVCMIADAPRTAVRGDLVFFIMTGSDTADRMVSHFNEVPPLS